ncbi:MAG: hypothetical protein WC455_25000 [Dehalococcoidia bacterium]|jgi:hypothetical protein
MVAKPKDGSQEPITLKRIEMETITVPIVGISELIVHNWSEKAKRQMLEKQMKPGTRTKKEPKDPVADYEASKYKTPEGKDAMVSTAFKQAMVDSLRYFDGVSMVLGKTAFFVEGEFVEIEGEPRMREDMVRLDGPSRTADIRYRAGYPEWRATLRITYAKQVLTKESILSLVETAGQTQGIGDWRPSSKKTTGPFGRFTIDQDRPIEVI